MTMTGDIRFQSREELIRRIEKMEEWEEMRLAQVKGLQEALDISVDFILGGGLTEEGKERWRENYGGTGDPIEMVRKAIKLTEGMIAT